MSIVQVFRPINLMLSMFGCGVVRFDYKMASQPFRMQTVLFMPWIIIIAYEMINKYHTLHDDENMLHFVVFSQNIVVTCFIICYVLSLSSNRMDLKEDLFTTLLDLEKWQNRFYSRTDAQNFAFTVFVPSTVTIFLGVISVPLYAIVYYGEDIVQFVDAASFIVPNLLQVSFMVLIGYLWFWVVNVNKVLERVCCRDSLVVEMRCMLALDCSYVMIRLADAYKLMNVIYAVPMSILLIQNIIGSAVTFCVLGMWLFRDIDESQVILSNVFAVWRLFTLVILCETLYAAVDRANDICLTIMNDHNSGTIRRAVKNIRRTIAHRLQPFAAARFYCLDAANLKVILTSILEYIFIVLQLQATAIGGEQRGVNDQQTLDGNKTM